jgi:hypothetical protein
LAAYWTSALLWSSETALSTAFRVSKESHYSAAVVADLVDQVNRFSYAGVDDASFLVEILVKEGVACPRPAFARSASTVRPFAAE